MTVPDVFRRITAALDQAGIEFMLTGSFASAYYGAPRSTQDIDLVIAASPDQLRAFVTKLPVTEYYADMGAALQAHQQQSLFNVIDVTTGWKIDLIVLKSRAFSQEEFRRRHKVNLHGASLYLASAEDSVISKLEWAKLSQSQRQIQDVASILIVRWDALDRAYLEKWITGLQLTEPWAEARRAAGILS